MQVAKQIIAKFRRLYRMGVDDSSLAYNHATARGELPTARVEILGRRLHESLETTIKLREQERRKLEAELASRADQAEDRSRLICWAVEQAVFDHLGFGPTAELEATLNSGLDQACDFFVEDWWQKSDEDRLVLDKSSDFPVQDWQRTVRDAVLLAHWTGRWEDARLVLDWVDEDVARGIDHGFPELDLYLYMISLVHSELSIHEALSRSVRRTCSRFQNLLADACEAIADGDEDRFANSIRKAVKQFLASEAEDVPNFMHWISPELSLVWAFAEHQGLALPELDLAADAVIVRPASIFPGRPVPFSHSALVDQDDLDSGLLTAVAELDFDAFESLLRKGADPDRERVWEADLFEGDLPGGAPATTTSRKLITALRDRFAGLQHHGELRELAATVLKRAKRTLTDDDIEAQLDGFCDLIDSPRPSDL